MSSLKAYQLLVKAATLSIKQKEAYNRQEIVKKINEIKYLSRQKRVPKVSLQKEIIHLEHLMAGIVEFDQHILKQERKESAKVTGLKKQIARLRKNVALAEDKSMHKKIDKLAHLLGDALAKDSVMGNVELQKLISDIQKKYEPERWKKRQKELKQKEGPPQPAPIEAKEVSPAEKRDWEEREKFRLQTVQHKLTVAKHELQIQTNMDADPQKIQQVKDEIARLEKESVARTMPTEAAGGGPAAAGHDAKHRAEGFRHRVSLMRHELELKKRTETDPKKLQVLEQKIALLERKLQEYLETHPEAMSQRVEPLHVGTDVTHQMLGMPQPTVQHVMLFGQGAPVQSSPGRLAGLGQPAVSQATALDKAIDQEVEKELPLPPPPREI